MDSIKLLYITMTITVKLLSRFEPVVCTIKREREKREKESEREDRHRRERKTQTRAK